MNGCGFAVSVAIWRRVGRHAIKVGQMEAGAGRTDGGMTGGRLTRTTKG